MQPREKLRGALGKWGTAGAILLMMLLAWTPGISLTEDLGRHLLLGRLILETGSVPDTNALTFTHPAFPFLNHHWLSEVILYQLHEWVGLNGLIVIKMLVLAGSLALALYTVAPRRGSALYWLAGILAAVMLGFRAHIRPELVTYLGVALYGWMFERIRKGAHWPRWVIPAVAVIWANCHIYFIFGLGMATAFALERWWWRHWRRSVFLKELFWLALLTAASCLTPHGLRGLLYPFRIFTNYGVNITENATPFEYWQTVLNPMLLALPVMALVMGFSLLVIALGRGRAARDGRLYPLRLANIWIAIAAFAGTLLLVRSVSIWALTVLPVVGEACTLLGSPAPATLGSRRRLFSRAIFSGPATVGLALLCIVLNIALPVFIVGGQYSRVFPSPIAPTSFGFDREARYLNLRKLQSDGLRGPIFNDYNMGSLVEYALYPEPAFVDNRPEAFPEPFWRLEYGPALALGRDWELIRDHHGINAVAVSLTGVRERFTQQMMSRPEWALVHLDSICAVWVRNAPENADLIASRRFDENRLRDALRQVSRDLVALYDAPLWRRQVDAEHLLFRLYGLICIGQGDRAWPYIRAFYNLYPDYQALQELIRVTAPPEFETELRAILDRNARWPRAVKQVMDWAQVLEQEERMDEARRVYARGLKFFPFSPRLQAALRFLDDRIYARERFTAPVPTEPSPAQDPSHQ